MLWPRTTKVGCALAVALAAGCGGPRRAARPEARPAGTLVEVLPRGARVSLDGRALGQGSRTVAAPPAGEHVLLVEADGYEPAGRALPEGDLDGVRVAEALRPAGFAPARALDYDDAAGLALAAAFLARSGDARDAADYAERALALDRGLALAHRVLGDARLRLGERGRAIDAWTEYLKLAPAAPDAGEVSALVDEARGDVTVR